MGTDVRTSLVIYETTLPAFSRLREIGQERQRSTNWMINRAIIEYAEKHQANTAADNKRA